jgi:putative hydrolase of the HAD superfamily
MRFRAVLLDLGDTVFGLGPVDTETVARGFATALAEHAGLDAVRSQTEALRVMEALRTDWRQAYSAGALAEPRIAVVAAPHLDRFGAIAETLGNCLEGLFGAADVARFQPAADCAARVQQLRDAGLRVGIVSNTTTPPLMLTTYLETLGVASFAQAIAFSVEIGFRKPHESIYRSVLDRLDVAPEQALFVGDRVREDVLGPRKLGMEAVLTHEFRQEPPGDSEPLAIVQSLWDVTAFLS